jgi:hypothetical protein
LVLEYYILNKKRKQKILNLELKAKVDEIKNNLTDSTTASKEDIERINLISDTLEVDLEYNQFTEKPKMSVKQMVFYSVLYLLTCYVFLELMNFTSHLPGCKEAFEALQ